MAGRVMLPTALATGLVTVSTVAPMGRRPVERTRPTGSRRGARRPVGRRG